LALVVTRLLLLCFVVSNGPVSAAESPLSKENVESLRKEVASILAAYRAEVRKPVSQQANATFEAITKRIDEIWGELERVSHTDARLAALHTELANVYNGLLERSKSPESREKWEAAVEKAREREREREEQEQTAREAERRREAALQAKIRQQQEAAREGERRRQATVLAKKWPPNIEQAVIERKVFVGMTTEQAQLAWGPPARINETIHATGKFEQWVYGSDRYLYFESGKLTAIQSSR